MTTSKNKKRIGLSFHPSNMTDLQSYIFWRLEKSHNKTTQKVEFKVISGNSLKISSKRTHWWSGECGHVKAKYRTYNYNSATSILINSCNKYYLYIPYNDEWAKRGEI